MIHPDTFTWQLRSPSTPERLLICAADTGLAVTVAHLPPGASRWNKIEHRPFAQITLNWRGRPLTSHQVIVDLIANTTTATALSVRAVLDTGQYPIGISYSDKDIAAIPLIRHDFHGVLVLAGLLDPGDKLGRAHEPQCDDQDDHHRERVDHCHG